MVVAKNVKSVMSPGELEIRIKKRWIARHSLIQQINGLQQIPFLSGSDAACPHKKIFATRVQIERGDIARRWTFDCAFLTWRKFCLQLVGNGLCDLALNREYVRQIAIIRLRPQVLVGTRID